MKDSINVILPTIRFLPLTRDVIRNLIGATEDVPDIHLTIADGQEDAAKREWILTKAEGIAARGCFTYIGIRDLAERVWLSVQRDSEWILSVSDDDWISINMIRSISETARSADLAVTAVTPYSYAPFANKQLGLSRLKNLVADSQKERLIDLLGQSHLLGHIMWGALRRNYYLDWLKFTRTKRVPPTYCDQLLAAYVAMKGKVIACEEVCLYGKDNDVWCDFSAAVLKDATGYSDKTGTLFHDLFFVTDIYTLLANNGLEDEALLPVSVWADCVLSHGVKIFEERMRILQIEHSSETAMARSMLRSIADEAKLLVKKPIARQHDFFKKTQSISATLLAEPPARRQAAASA